MELTQQQGSITPFLKMHSWPMHFKKLGINIRRKGCNQGKRSRRGGGGLVHRNQEPAARNFSVLPSNCRSVCLFLCIHQACYWMERCVHTLLQLLNSCYHRALSLFFEKPITIHTVYVIMTSFPELSFGKKVLMKSRKSNGQCSYFTYMLSITIVS